MPQQQSVGATDILCPYGGGITFDPTGNPVIVRDTPSGAAATQQRIEVLAFTNPRAFDVNGVGNGRPDDLFHPDYGIGLRAIVGQNPSPVLDAGVRARTLKGLSLDAAVANTPPPQVTTTSVQGTYYVSIKATTTTGLPFTITRALGG